MRRVIRAALVLAAAERALGRKLSDGQKVDFLLDTFSWLRNSSDARTLLHALAAAEERIGGRIA